jgi:hypothetical protein
MTTLMQAHKQWKTRPDDERFLSLLAMRDHFDSEAGETREQRVQPPAQGASRSGRSGA